MPRISLAIILVLFVTGALLLQAGVVTMPIGTQQRDQFIVLSLLAILFVAWLARRLGFRRSRRAGRRRIEATRDRIRDVYVDYALQADTGQLRQDLDRWARELYQLELRGPAERTRELIEIVSILRAEIQSRAERSAGSVRERAEAPARATSEALQ